MLMLIHFNIGLKQVFLYTLQLFHTDWDGSRPLNYHDIMPIKLLMIDSTVSGFQ